MKFIKKVLVHIAFSIIQSHCFEKKCTSCPFGRKDSTCILTQRNDGCVGKYYPEDWDINDI